MHLPSAVWRSLWLFKVPFDLNFFPHISHRWVFSVLWRFMWAFKLLLLRVAYSQREHLKGFTPQNEKNIPWNNQAVPVQAGHLHERNFRSHEQHGQRKTLSKFGSLQIRNFIYSFCLDDAELMTASLNLLRERRSSVTTEYCSVEARYWV